MAMVEAEVTEEWPTAAVELSAPGSAVIALGPDGEFGANAIAVWHVSPHGTRTGAWVYAQHDAFTAQGTARTLLTLLERRSITAVAVDEIDAVLTKVTAAAALDQDVERWWAAHLFTAPQAFQEVLARRTAIEDAVDEARGPGRSIAALEWSREFTDGDNGGSFDGLRVLAGVGAAAGSVGLQAIAVASMLQWLVRIWAETEQVKNRRSYVQDALGAPEALPPSWLAAVRTAAATVLPL